MPFGSQIGHSRHIGSAPLTLLAALILVPVLSKMSVSSVFGHLSWPTCAPTYSLFVNKWFSNGYQTFVFLLKVSSQTSHRLLISGQQHTPFPLLPDFHHSWLLQSALTLRILQTSVQESAWKCFWWWCRDPVFLQGQMKGLIRLPKWASSNSGVSAHAGYEFVMTESGTKPTISFSFGVETLPIGHWDDGGSIFHFFGNEGHSPSLTKNVRKPSSVRHKCHFLILRLCCLLLLFFVCLTTAELQKQYWK